MTEQEQSEQEGQQPDLSDLITRVVDALKTETAWVLQKAQTMEATADTSSQHEFEELAGQCDELSQKGHSSAAELTQGGVQDWVYSVKACNEVAYWATDGAGHARQAASSDSPTEIKSMLGSCVNSISNASYSINGA
jgi:hypothetical protein